MNNMNGGVTAAKGFKAAHTAAGIKKDKTDMAMVVCDVPCEAAGTFTSNVVKAAPVLYDREVVYGTSKPRAVVVNSGIANACTGEEGLRYCRETAEEAARLLNCDQDMVLVASTGVIGMQVPVDRIKKGIAAMLPGLSDSAEAANAAAKAIMTTDTREKECAVSFELGDKTVTVGGMCKGSGMIHPNMCTMLGFITTDANISKEMLQKALSAAIADSFNMITVDGDTSTNDTVLLLASGLAENEKIAEENEAYALFYEALFTVCRELAMKIAEDGEGATALFEAKVSGAASKEDARLMARAVVGSNLSKAAVFGHDANWGRFLCALGYSGAQFDPSKAELYIESAAGRMQLVKDGFGVEVDEEFATKILSEAKVTVIADVHAGDFSATAWGCDLSYEYVKINADYRS